MSDITNDVARNYMLERLKRLKINGLELVQINIAGFGFDVKFETSTGWVRKVEKLLAFENGKVTDETKKFMDKEVDIKDILNGEWTSEFARTYIKCRFGTVKLFEEKPIDEKEKLENGFSPVLAETCHIISRFDYSDKNVAYRVYYGFAGDEAAKNGEISRIGDRFVGLLSKGETK